MDKQRSGSIGSSPQLEVDGTCKYCIVILYVVCGCMALHSLHTILSVGTVFQIGSVNALVIIWLFCTCMAEFLHWCVDR